MMGMTAGAVFTYKSTHTENGTTKFATESDVKKIQGV